MSDDLASSLGYVSVGEEDFEALVALRTEAMRESLEQVGRFDPERARERLRATFFPEHTRIVAVSGEHVGFYTFRPLENVLRLDHFYIRPRWQSRGLGSLVLKKLADEADERGLPIHLGALKESASNRFYQCHGFSVERVTEWDVYYVRFPGRKKL